MFRRILLWTLCLLPFAASSQDEKQAVALMNACVTAYSSEPAQPVSYYAISGILEQKQAGLTQRISMAEVASAKVSTGTGGYSVTLGCDGGEGCVTLLKSDMSSSTMGSTAFFFNNPAAANSFATLSMQLALKARKGAEPGELSLFRDAQGQTPLLPGTEAGKPSEAKPQEAAKAKTPPVKKEEKATPEAEDEDAEAGTGKKDSKEKASKARTKEQEEKPVPEKKTRRTAEKKEQEEEEAEADEEEKTRKSKRSAEPVSDEPADDEGKARRDFCAQLMTVIKSGAAGFKDIEGKETNTEKKINESKIKLKGARKNYLSWFEQKRAFIAELKVLADNDYAIEAFEAMQAEMDECLADGWDMDDRSHDEAYENARFEVKDVEYTNTRDASSPSVRMAIAPDGKKFVLFLRVK